MTEAAQKIEEAPPPLKLDLGCGKQKKEGFVGLDRIAFDGVDHVLELGRDRWPFDDSSVDEAHSSHCVEHLVPIERIHFVNELCRVLKPGAKCQVIVPCWSSTRAYGDPTHQWPPVSEFWFYYLNREWRKQNAPHTDIEYWLQGFDCDFDSTWGNSLHPAIAARNDEYKQHAVMFFKDATMDLIATLIKK